MAFFPLKMTRERELEPERERKEEREREHRSSRGVHIITKTLCAGI